jgi:prolyl 4-hydroxylase
MSRSRHRKSKNYDKVKKETHGDKGKKDARENGNKDYIYKPLIKMGKKIFTNPHPRGSIIDTPKEINPEYFPKGFSTKILSDKPYIVKIRRFLESCEIDILLSMAEGLFTRSKIVVDGEMIDSIARTSQTAFITDNGHYKHTDDPIINNVLNKVCYLTGCNTSQIEALMVVKYLEGDEYQEHHDYFYEDDQNLIEGCGQRMATFFVYLNSLDDDKGGETEFPKLDLKIKPSKGTATFWWNQNKHGDVIPETLHRGNPVKGRKTIKYGLNIWIREYGY